MIDTRRAPEVTAFALQVERPDEEPEALGTYGPEGVARCPTCHQMANFVYLDEARGQARGVCSRCGADWWL